MMLLRGALPCLLSFVAATASATLLDRSSSSGTGTVASAEVVVTRSGNAGKCSKRGGLFIPKTSLCGYKQRYLKKHLRRPKLPTRYRQRLKHALKGLRHSHLQGSCPCHSQPYYGMDDLRYIKDPYQRQLYSHQMMLQDQLRHPNFPCHRRVHVKRKIRGLHGMRCLDGHCKAHRQMTKYEMQSSKLQSQLKELERMARSPALTHDMRALLKRYLGRLRSRLGKISLRVRLERQQRDLYQSLMDPSLNSTMRQALQSQMKVLKKRLTDLSRPRLVGAGKEQVMLKAHIADLKRMLRSSALSTGARRELQNHLNALQRRLVTVGRMAQLDQRRHQIRRLLQQDNMSSIMRDALQMQLRDVDMQVYRLKHKPKVLSPDMQRQQALMNQQQCLSRLCQDPNVSSQLKKVLQGQLKQLKYQTTQMKKCQGINRQMNELRKIMSSSSCTPQMRATLQRQMQSLQKSYKKIRHLSTCRGRKAIKKARKAVKKADQKISRSLHGPRRPISKTRRKLQHKMHKAVRKNALRPRPSKPRGLAKRVKHRVKKSVRRTRKALKHRRKLATKGTTQSVKGRIKRTLKGVKKSAKSTGKRAKHQIKKAVHGIKGKAKTISYGAKPRMKRIAREIKKPKLKTSRGSPLKGLKKVVKKTGKIAKKAAQGVKTTAHKTEEQIRKTLGKATQTASTLNGSHHAAKCQTKTIQKELNNQRKKVEKAMKNAGASAAASVKQLQQRAANILNGRVGSDGDKYGLF